MKHTRKLVIASLLAATFSQAHAAGDSVNFTGRVIDESCSVDASSDLDVSLGDVLMSHITPSGAKSAAVPFKIILSGCPANEDNLSITFSGSTDTTNAALLAATAGESGTAAGGVGIGIYDDPTGSGSADGTVMDMSANQKSTVQSSDETGSATFNFVADIENDGSTTVTGGDANATANITINYE